MTIKIVDGITLETITTQQFKNNAIVINLTIPTDHRNFPKFALLAELLENASAAYPGEMLVSRKLSTLYGASYGVTVLRYGNQHTLRMRLAFPNDTYLPGETDLLRAGFTFLMEMLLHPYVKQGHFEKKFFKIHRENLANYLKSIPDNHEFYSTLKLQELYYANDKDQGGYLLGDPDGILSQDAGELYQFYLELLRTAQIHVLVAGQVDVATVDSLVRENLKLSARDNRSQSLYIIPKQIDQPQKKIVRVAGSQSILNLAYRLPVYFNSKQYFAATMLNQIFGGSTRSLLFTNVREKASLAYDIHSNYNSLSGMLTVQAGIDFQKVDQVVKTISEQLTAIKAGSYSDDLLIGIKKSMINNHRVQSDYLNTQLERAYIQDISGVVYTDEAWESAVNAVTKALVASVASELSQRAQFILQTEVDRHENH